jgi:hypothetical protein
LGNDQEPPPIHSIRNNPAWDGKNHDRKSAEESRQPQLERGVGNLINLPRDSDCRNLAPHAREKEANPKKAKVSLRENLPGRNLSGHGVDDVSIGWEKRNFVFPQL